MLVSLYVTSTVLDALPVAYLYARPDRHCMKPGNMPAKLSIPAEKAICEDAFNKVIAINIVNDAVDQIGADISTLVNPYAELFTMQERNKIENVFGRFYEGMKDVLDKKAANYVDTLNDCIKRELVPREPDMTLFT